MKRLGACCFAWTLSACAATGTQVKEQQLQAFKIGETSYEDVIKQLGTPNQRMTSADGTKQAVYIYAEAQTRPETFIPIVGAFAGGMDTRSNVVILFFDRRDMLTDYKTSESAFGTGLGLSRGNTQGRNSEPPKDVD